MNNAERIGGVGPVRTNRSIDGVSGQSSVAGGRRGLGNDGSNRVAGFGDTSEGDRREEVDRRGDPTGPQGPRVTRSARQTRNTFPNVPQLRRNLWGN